jgi:hypothetical protein
LASVAREAQQGDKIMADDLKNRGPQDRARINVNERHEVDYWSEALGCTEQQLRDAVAAVGVSAQAVREYLR